jgi:very-short-patch-repair endonuclease
MFVEEAAAVHGSTVDSDSNTSSYTVIHFWEKEIKCDIDRCIQTIKDYIQAYKDKHTNRKNSV